MAEEASDKQLVDGCVRGERRFQELLYKRFSPKMYSVCLGYAGRGNEAADMLQDAFIKVFRNIGEFRFDCPLEAWIRRIVVNTAIDQYRKASRQAMPLSLDDTLELDDETVFSHPSDHKYFLDLVSALPDGYRLIFNLYVIEGLNHREIAEQVGISEGTSKSQLARAKKYLQQKLKQETATNPSAQKNEGRSFQLV
ncbi:MAG TPA: RNA polymerase sigma factor [Flavobacteriales bacterium]|jgi:RNA polymerase sigma-70 factor (ECF subfamily)|nr:RNA polymerase sigma factor [Flavobacteriales bacterium]HPH82876.1 RNA polymerase sigma factor [Flavobacteriales bacterium]